MAQAKTLTATELRRVLDYIATRPHAARNRAIVLCGHWAGLRAGETASLRYMDVLDDKGQVRGEIRLDADQTKGKHGRVVFVPEKLRKELQRYIATTPNPNPAAKLFYSQKNKKYGFTANTLAQMLHYLYKNAGQIGCSSHSGRRSFLTCLSSAGVSVRVLMSLAGHKNLSTTQKYLDVNDDMLRKAVELV